MFTDTAIASPKPIEKARAARVPRWLRHVIRVTLQLVMDAAAIILAYRLAYEIRFHWAWWTARFPFVGDDPGWAMYRRLLFSLVPLWISIFWYSAHLYTRPWMRSTDRFLFLLKGTILGALATLSATFIYGRLEYSRHTLILAVVLVLALVSVTQWLALSLDKWIALFESTSPLLILGGGKVADLIRENLLWRHPGMRIHQINEPSGKDEVLAFACAHSVSEVILVKGQDSEARILELAEACDSSGINFKMIPGLLELRLGEIQMDDTLGVPAYRMQHTSLSAANFMVKRLFDIAAGATVAVVTFIPMCGVALLIKLDSRGPIFYRQKRIGLKGKPFEAFKFRTMIIGAEAGLARVRGLNDQRGGFFKAKQDPRVTRVGRWLRRFSLDEFPQFINVLRGEMSVVGPRPLAVSTGEEQELLREFGATAKKRFNILPGITGLWQVSGRSDVSSEQRFALDLFYIEHWSLGLDLQIILKTIPAMISGKGAY